MTSDTTKFYVKMENGDREIKFLAELNLQIVRHRKNYICVNAFYLTKVRNECIMALIQPDKRPYAL